MIILRHFCEKDIPMLEINMHKSHEEIASMLAEWNLCSHNGKYFEMFAVISEDVVVGSVSLYQHNDYIISAGPEIFPQYRCQGYAYEAMTQVYAYAKNKGYKIASAQIRKNNLASIKLHEKLGFVLDSEMINRHGNEIFIYLKLL